MKKLNLFSIALFFCLVSSLIFTSCVEEEDNLSQEASIENEIISNRMVLASVLSEAIVKNPSLATLMERLALAQQETGYYEQELFFNIEKDIVRSELGNRSISDFLIDSYGERAEKSIGFLCENDPGLAILLFNDTEATTYNSKVFIDDGVNDSDENALVKYYNEGVQSSQALSVLPSEVTFVVRKSEAYISAERLAIEKQNRDASEFLNLGETCGQTIMVDNGYVVVPEERNELPTDVTLDARSCYRGDYYGNGKDRFYGFSSSNDYEGWLMGNGEFLVYTIFADNVGFSYANGGVQISGNPMGVLKRRYTGVQDNNSWYVVQSDIITWNREGDGDRMKYVFYEDDGGSTYSINLGLSIGVPVPGTPVEVGGSFDIPIQLSNGDDFIGESFVEFCDPIYYYAAGGFGYSIPYYRPSNDVTFIVSKDYPY